MYGRENRLKVAQDEAKYEEEQKEQRARHEQAERETRRQLLLARARQRSGAPQEELPGPPERTGGSVGTDKGLAVVPNPAEPFSLFTDDLASNSEVHCCCCVPSSAPAARR